MLRHHWTPPIRPHQTQLEGFHAVCERRRGYEPASTYASFSLTRALLPCSSLILTSRNARASSSFGDGRSLAGQRARTPQYVMPLHPTGIHLTFCQFITSSTIHNQSSLPRSWRRKSTNMYVNIHVNSAFYSNLSPQIAHPRHHYQRDSFQQAGRYYPVRRASQSVSRYIGTSSHPYVVPCLTSFPEPRSHCSTSWSTSALASRRPGS